MTTSPDWARTVLVINYDEWGGFFDHVAPPTRPLPPATRAAGDVDGCAASACPACSSRRCARRGHVAHGVYDHTSILKMIEWRFGLPPLTVRDAAANNLADELAAARRSGGRRSSTSRPGPFGGACPVPAPAAAATTRGGESARRAPRSAGESEWDRAAGARPVDGLAGVADAVDLGPRRRGPGL